MTISQFLKKKPYLFWYVRDLDGLSEASIVEHILNYGDWDDVRKMIEILGMDKVAGIFRARSVPDKFGRQNYLPEIKNYFNIYFDKHARRDSNK